MVTFESGDITEEEAALYDRQIRLWGLDAQKRLRSARVLLIHMGGLGAEVAKNLILAGVKSLTMLDPNPVTSSEASCQFFVPAGQIGANRAEVSVERAQRLNPMVSVTAEKTPSTQLTEEQVARYDVLVATGCPDSELTRLNALCRRRGVLFLAGDVYGFCGFMFADLGRHEFAEEVPVLARPSGEPAQKRPRTEQPESRTVKRTLQFTPLEDALGVDWNAEDRRKTLRRTSDVYFIMRVLQAFRAEEGRRPLATSADTDAARLLALRDSLKGLPTDKVGDAFTSRCLGELSPACAVVGGVLAQEVIKAVSQKDKPLSNFFLFDGYNSEGVVETIAA
ncbi:SUMO-activating enzyme subunit 1-like [Amphibalanus amphitrite]|uniref:SUMO-activating enzyme subunit 1-like n=1 Tax=Amphibalanus amphitrite TaxID=1232801 RepID=UPI001C91D115|nr:SUMO-activating enzyme subunit 1-like [Amphibalanus amphitrite]XP_043226163.1 SUMO-activating enzyme subunit 1-like [Amphibalanus amphitrite]XP_043226165.1 SUMO-activating enzyme subunit 1-like [Amphibalanus amphitrite]XP_043226166.1 SUMO-activating enzyme subunit 1-like [Amphibalanus amphitrite]XP_043226167.1 SUMO-activating enzyme subunit 1-like [Amphibalanus amphitrite]XP_043226168.1 SUMO-activating enzyme subunit 1-like [Amphibalanus amphitrite]